MRNECYGKVTVWPSGKAVDCRRKPVPGFSHCPDHMRQLVELRHGPECAGCGAPAGHLGSELNYTSGDLDEIRLLCWTCNAAFVAPRQDGKLNRPHWGPYIANLLEKTGAPYPNEYSNLSVNGNMDEVSPAILNEWLKRGQFDDHYFWRCKRDEYLKRMREKYPGHFERDDQLEQCVDCKRMIGRPYVVRRGSHIDYLCWVCHRWYLRENGMLRRPKRATFPAHVRREITLIKRAALFGSEPDMDYVRHLESLYVLKDLRRIAYKAVKGLCPVCKRGVAQDEMCLNIERNTLRCKACHLGASMMKQMDLEPDDDNARWMLQVLPGYFWREWLRSDEVPGLSEDVVWEVPNFAYS